MVHIVPYYLNHIIYCYCNVNFFALLLVLMDIIDNITVNTFYVVVCNVDKARLLGAIY
jgi:hypothetical protein